MASINKKENVFGWASPGAWRYLGWQTVDEETGGLKLLLAETFGPLPGNE